MKNIIVLFLLLCFSLNAQHSISGTFSPAKEFKWLVAYHLKAGTQNYIADTAVKDGAFTLTIEDDKPIGIYRLVYAVPQEEFYFDVIYNGKEDVKLNFDVAKGVTFTESKENIPYSLYLNNINKHERQLISFYTSGNTNTSEFNDILNRLNVSQKEGEKQTLGLISNGLIKANRPYIPKQFETLEQYVSNKKKNYFNALDFSKQELQASGLLTDKLMNYVFTALPLEQTDPETNEMHIQENVDTIVKKLHGVNDAYLFSVLYTLWSQAAASRFNAVSDYTYNNYLKELAIKTENTQAILDIEVHNRLRIGAKAPEVEWRENDKTKKLSTDQEGENYLLVFWSSTCSHCLKELPALHKELGKNEKLKVIAIGLEDNETNWAMESQNLPNFVHAIALGKWDSAYADLYNIQATPSYFLLDKEKRIIAKPESDRDVVELLRKKQ